MSVRSVCMYKHTCVKSSEGIHSTCASGEVGDSQTKTLRIYLVRLNEGFALQVSVCIIRQHARI